MKNIGIVYGSSEQAKPVVVGLDTVYEHSNIVKITKPNEHGDIPDNLYKYDEIQYTKDEYIDLVLRRNKELNDALLDADAISIDHEERILMIESALREE